MGRDQTIKNLLEVTIMHSLGGIEFTVTMLQPAVASCGRPFSARLTVAGHGQQTKTEISPEESGEKSDTGME